MITSWQRRWIQGRATWIPFTCIFQYPAYFTRNELCRWE